MRIGILTLVLHANYGGILQAFAMQTVLERMGHEVQVFNAPSRYVKPSLLSILKRFVKMILGKESIIFKERKSFFEAPIINANLYNFKKKYIHELSLNDLSDVRNDSFDGIVVGSDQVWRPCYFKEQWRTGMENAFLAFVKGKKMKRISYAASLGVDEWEFSPEETTMCKSLIADFDAIGVRESSGVDLLKKYFEVEAVKVIDPTMLLDKDDYMALVENEFNNCSRGELLTYILDNNEEKTNFVNRVAAERNIKIFSVNNTMVSKSSPVEQRVLPSIEDWICGFYQAKFVITDSFHACVFSIIFKKPFVAIGNLSRGLSRFKSLLSDFGLDDHLLTNFTQYDSLFSYEIPETVYDKLNSQREFAYNFLKSNLR